jgi:hypothetical protein
MMRDKDPLTSPAFLPRQSGRITFFFSISQKSIPAFNAAKQQILAVGIQSNPIPPRKICVAVRVFDHLVVNTVDIAGCHRSASW